MKNAFLTVEWSFHVKIIDFIGEKIENHQMGHCRHIDMFSRKELHRQIDSAQLGIHKRPFTRTKWGENMPF